jgi:hypothetical protein
MRLRRGFTSRSNESCLKQIGCGCVPLLIVAGAIVTLVISVFTGG